MLGDGRRRRRRRGGGGIKQASPAQMTHDMALRPGPLFMASHVSAGSLPWGALQPLTCWFSSGWPPGLISGLNSHTCTHTIHCRNSDRRNDAACTHD